MLSNIAIEVGLSTADGEKQQRSTKRQFYPVRSPIVIIRHVDREGEPFSFATTDGLCGLSMRPLRGGTERADSAEHTAPQPVV